MSTHGPKFSGVEFNPPKHPMVVRGLHLRGTSFDGRQQNLKKVHDTKGVFIYLQREPKNKYDKHAIRVFAMSDVWPHGPLDIGFVPTEIAGMLAPLMDTGTMNVHVILKKSVGGGGKYTRGVIVDLVASHTDQDFDESEDAFGDFSNDAFKFGNELSSFYKDEDNARCGDIQDMIDDEEDSLPDDPPWDLEDPEQRKEFHRQSVEAIERSAPYHERVDGMSLEFFAGGKVFQYDEPLTDDDYDDESWADKDVERKMFLSVDEPFDPEEGF